jgi:AcrR family transcriptional regulator
MTAEGYAAVSTRRVAKEAGLTSALVHYYFPATDDLFLATYRHAHQRTLQQLAKALVSPRPLEALWKLNTDPDQTALGVELLALGNHRKVISEEVARTIEEGRTLQASAIASVLGVAPADAGGLSPLALVALMTAIARALAMEGAHGVTLGHAELRAAVEGWIREHRPQPPTPGEGGTVG